MGFPSGVVVQLRRHETQIWCLGRKNPWRRAWQPTPILLPEASQEQRSLAGYSPQGHRTRHDWSDLAHSHIQSRPLTPFFRKQEDPWVFLCNLIWSLQFSCGSSGKESACNARDLGSIPGLGRSPGEEGYPLQYSGLEKPTDCIVWGVKNSLTGLNDFYFHIVTKYQWLICLETHFYRS